MGINPFIPLRYTRLSLFRSADLVFFLGGAGYIILDNKFTNSRRISGEKQTLSSYGATCAPHAHQIFYAHEWL